MALQLHEIKTEVAAEVQYSPRENHPGLAVILVGDVHQRRKSTVEAK
jgi:hypothetical protein